MVIKKSIVPIMRVVVKNAKGERELKATLRLSHMIPVPASELELYDLAYEFFPTGTFRLILGEFP